MKKYQTDNISTIICNYYNGNISSVQSIQSLKKVKKSDLANYVLDSFIRETLNSENIKRIPAGV